MSPIDVEIRGKIGSSFFAMPVLYDQISAAMDNDELGSSLKYNKRIAVCLCLFVLAGCIRLPNTAQPANAHEPTAKSITTASPLAAVIKKQDVPPRDPEAAIPPPQQAAIEPAKTDPTTAMLSR